MNLSINPISNYSGSMNYQKKNNPSFGMAIKFNKNAFPVIKKQAMKLNLDSDYEQFWSGIHAAIERQKDNPVNITISKTKMRNGLTAVVVDADTETAISNSKFTQDFRHGNGNLEFLTDAEEYANKLKDANTRISDFFEEY